MKQLSLFSKNEEIETENNAPRKKRIVSNPYLGPKTPSIGYRKYLNSKEWQAKRLFAIKAAKYKCQRCGATDKLEVHHKDYECLYHERLKDVEVLCPKCHPVADSEREEETAYTTYAYKKYGDDWWKYDGEQLQSEFEEWYEDKLETDYWF